VKEQISIDKETYQALMHDRYDLLREIMELHEERKKIIQSMKMHILDPQVMIVHKISDSVRTLAINECIALVEINSK
jgi:hypothetical protein